jgi:hypothetical protein
MKLGYGKLQEKITFENASQDRSAYALIGGAFQKSAGIFFVDVKKNFSDWAARLEIVVIHFDPNKRHISSTRELAEFVDESLLDRYTLVDGREFVDRNTVSIEQIGIKSVVVALSANRGETKTLKLKGGGDVTLTPYEFYYIRLDAETAVVLRLFHDNQKTTTQEALARRRKIVAQTIAEMTLAPL